MKAIKAGFLFFIVLLTFFSTYSFFENKEALTTFKLYTSPSLQISKDIIEAYEGGDDLARKDAKEKLIQRTLRNLDYDKWLEFEEYIDLQLHRGHILPNNNSQLLVVLNLSKDQSVLAIYDFINDAYIYNTKIEGLTPIETIEFVSFEAENYDYLIIKQVIDEGLGAFFFEKYMEIYLYNNSSFQRVWNKTLFYEETYKEIWVNPNASETLWNKIQEETLVDFVNGNPLRINTVTTFKKMVAQGKEMPKLTQFTVVQNNTHKNSYYWSPDYNTFILAELSQTVFLTKAALLQDMELSREALYNINNKNYRLITTKGEIIYLPKSKFQGLFKNLLEE